MTGFADKEPGQLVYTHSDPAHRNPLDNRLFTNPAVSEDFKEKEVHPIS
jgi:hypothetical protein